jgi:hypothetical protein
MATRRKRKPTDLDELRVADQEKEHNARGGSCDRRGTADVPGQAEPSAEAEGENEPELDEALARRLTR